MTQLKKNNITVDVGDYTVDLNETDYSPITITDYDTSLTDGTYTVNVNDLSIDTGSTIDSFSWDFGNKIDPDKVENMCRHYPSLEKVWRNFKSVYDMCKQDYEGKKKAGEIDDDIPF